jgi:hypothetical protein
MWFRNLIVGSVFLALAGSAALSDGLPSGVMEGHLKILSRNPVDLGDENAATITAESYDDYPLVILSRDGQKEIARITANENGNYRVVLPPGDYVLKVQERKRTHLLQAATIHDCVESDCPRRYGYYCRGPVASWIDAIVPA